MGVRNSSKEVTGRQHPASLTIAETALIMHLSEITIRRMLDKKTLGAIRYPGTRTIRVDVESVFRLMSAEEPAAATADS